MWDIYVLQLDRLSRCIYLLHANEIYSCRQVLFIMISFTLIMFLYVYFSRGCGKQYYEAFLTMGWPRPQKSPPSHQNVAHPQGNERHTRLWWALGSSGMRESKEKMYFTYSIHFTQILHPNFLFQSLHPNHR